MFTYMSLDCLDCNMVMWFCSQAKFWLPLFTLCIFHTWHVQPNQIVLRFIKDFEKLLRFEILVSQRLFTDAARIFTQRLKRNMTNLKKKMKLLTCLAFARQALIIIQHLVENIWFRSNKYSTKVLRDEQCFIVSMFIQHKITM